MNTEPNIKYRVTGALVLIALAVIFLPLILDGQKKNQVLESKIPDKPETGEIILINIADSEKANEALKNKSEQLDDIGEQNLQPIESEKVKEVIVFPSTKSTKSTNNIDIKLVDKSTTEKETVKKVMQKSIIKAPAPKPVNTNIPDRSDRPKFKSSAYVIQIGSFSKKSSAQKIVAKLKAADYKAYIKQGKSSGKAIHRVLVGPELKREKAEAQLGAINKISGLKAIVLSYDPLRH